MTSSKILRLSLGLLLAGSLAACGGGSASESHESTDSTATEGGEQTAIESSPEVLTACTQEMTRERECSAEFIPALVALRVRLDHPAGIAARDTADHAGTIAAAQAEWAADSTDEHIAATCRDRSRLPAGEAQGYATSENHCLAAADCAAFVECDIRFTEERFHARMSTEVAPAEGTTPAQ